MSLRDIANEIGCNHSGIDVMLRGQVRAARPSTRPPRQGRLRAHESEEILLGLQRGESMSAIARDFDRLPSTVTREVKANGGGDAYRVWLFHVRAQEFMTRPKPVKLSNEALCVKVMLGLESFWSLKEIANRLRVDFPDDATMQTSPETIYQSPFAQRAGELRSELTRCLRQDEPNVDPRDKPSILGRW
jgi:IS30 family transposase